MSFFRAECVTKSFAKFTALAKVSLEVKAGEIRSIIGPNGAGKTTFFNVVSGKFRPDEGKIFFEDQDITGKPSYQIAKLGMARTFQIVSIFHSLTVLENLMLPILTERGKNRDFYSSPQNKGDLLKKSFDIARKIGLIEDAFTVAGSLSHGDKKKLDIGIGLAQNPRILLLDEPAAGLNPEDKQSITTLIKTIRDKEKLTIVLIEHDMDAVFSLSDSITVLQQGKVIAEGKPEEVKQNKLVVEAYLGEEF